MSNIQRTPQQTAFMYAIIQAGYISQKDPFPFTKQDGCRQFVTGTALGDLSYEELGSLLTVRDNIQNIFAAREAIQQERNAELQRQQEHPTTAPGGFPEVD